MITLQKVKVEVSLYITIVLKSYIAKTEKGIVLMLLALGQMLDFSDSQLSKNRYYNNFIAYFKKCWVH